MKVILNSYFNDIARFAHSASLQGYNCIDCCESFTEWKSFKRHNKEQHGDTPGNKCSYCAYAPKRPHDLKKHYARKHKLSVVTVSAILRKLMSDLLCDDLSDVAGNTDIVDQEPSHTVGESNFYSEDLVDSQEESADHETNNGVGEGVRDEESVSNEVSSTINPVLPICEYERIRNRIIADRDAEFRRMFPAFEDEMKELKMQKQRKKKSADIGQASVLPVRKSNRIKARDGQEALVESNSTISENNDDFAVMELSDDSHTVETIVVGEHVYGAWDIGAEYCISDSIVNKDDTLEVVTGSEVPEVSEHVSRVAVSENASIDCANSFNQELVESSNLGKYGCLPCGMKFR